MSQQFLPSYTSKAELLAILGDIIAVVAAGDSFEGSLSYEFPWDTKYGHPVTDPSGEGFRVRASYRTGNSTGQGGMRMMGEWREVPNDRR